MDKAGFRIVNFFQIQTETFTPPGARDFSGIGNNVAASVIRFCVIGTASGSQAAETPET